MKETNHNTPEALKTESTSADAAPKAVQPTPEDATTAPAESTATDDFEREPGVIYIPRTSLYYVLIAVLFFALGAASSYFFTRTNEAFITDTVNVAVSEAIAAAIEEQAAPADDGTVASAAGNGSADQRFSVSYEGNPFLGAEDAEVVIVEFSDFRCGYCGRFANQTLTPLMEEYGDRVRYVYRDFPILSEESLFAAMAAQCAADQDEFWEFHNLLFANQNQLSNDLYLTVAEELELDMDAFTTCVTDEVHRESVVEDYLAAQQLGIRGTPAFFINGRFVSGAQPFTAFAQVIEEELALVNEGAAETES